MALPGLKDLLPDHLFYEQEARPPPPPSTILPRLPALDAERRLPSYPASTPSYSDHRDAPYSYPQQPAPQTIKLGRPPSRRFDAHHPDIHGSAPLRGTFHQFGPVTVGAHADDNDDNEEDDDDDDDEKRKHACEKCGKRFNRPSSLRIHLNTHTGAKPYVCPFPDCNRSFNVSSNMRRHYRNHSRRAPPPLPINEIVAQAQAAQARVQMQIDMENQSRRTFSVEPPRLVQSGIGGSIMEARANGEGDGNGNGSMARGAEAAAKAARKASSSSSNFTHGSEPQQLQHRGPYRSQYAPQLLPPLHAQQHEYSPESPTQYSYPYPPPNAFHRPPLPPTAGRSQPYSPGEPTQYPYPDIHAHPRSSQPLRNYERDVTRGEYDTDLRNLKVDPKYGYPYPSAPALANASTSSLSSIYIEDSERGRDRAAHYAIPPTPPHTNEAATSPPASTNGNRYESRAVSDEDYDRDRMHNRSIERNRVQDRYRAYEKPDSDRGSHSYEYRPESHHLAYDSGSDQSRRRGSHNWEGGPGKDGEEDIYRPPVPLRPILASPVTLYEEDRSRRRDGAIKIGITTIPSESQERIRDYARSPRPSSQSSHLQRRLDSDLHAEAHGLEDSRYSSRRSRESSPNSVPHQTEEYWAERERETRMRRQQPSPDTPSIHVSELEEENSYQRPHHYDTAPARNDYYEHDRPYHRYELEHSRPFSASPSHPPSIETTPINEHAAPINVEESAPSPSTSTPLHAQCKSRLRSDSNSCPRANGNRNLLATEPLPHRHSYDQSSPPSPKEIAVADKTVGRTPGAAPPPPYPLYTYPPPELPISEEECQSTENKRATKRKKRS